ncbi:MAG TPA: hypothetical protein VF594_05245 [Rubricoccaceae bacterium]|jgi:hypothetical protein
MSGVRPEHDVAFWTDLAGRPWRRVRWRAGVVDVPSEAVCTAFGTPLHRTGTYYRRPVYTDGTVWLSQQAFDEMTRRTGRVPTRRTRPDASP